MVGGFGFEAGFYVDGGIGAELGQGARGKHVVDAPSHLALGCIGCAVVEERVLIRLGMMLAEDIFESPCDGIRECLANIHVVANMMGLFLGVVDVHGQRRHIQVAQPEDTLAR